MAGGSHTQCLRVADPQSSSLLFPLFPFRHADLRQQLLDGAPRPSSARLSAVRLLPDTVHCWRAPPPCEHGPWYVCWEGPFPFLFCRHAALLTSFYPPPSSSTRRHFCRRAQEEHLDCQDLLRSCRPHDLQSTVAERRSRLPDTVSSSMGHRSQKSHARAPFFSHKAERDRRR